MNHRIPTTAKDALFAAVEAFAKKHKIRVKASIENDPVLWMDECLKIVRGALPGKTYRLNLARLDPFRGRPEFEDFLNSILPIKPRRKASTGDFRQKRGPQRLKPI